MGKILWDNITFKFGYGQSLQSMYPKGSNHDFTDNLNFGILQYLGFELAALRTSLQHLLSVITYATVILKSVYLQ